MSCLLVTAIISLPCVSCGTDINSSCLLLSGYTSHIVQRWLALYTTKHMKGALPHAREGFSKTLR